MQNLFVPYYTHVNKVLRTQSTKYTGSDLVSDILKNAPLPKLPIFHKYELISYLSVFEICVRSTINLVKQAKDENLLGFLGNPATTDTLGYTQQLSDAMAMPSDDVNVLRRINNRLKVGETT